jgi:Tol biopolymer transport system component
MPAASQAAFYGANGRVAYQSNNGGTDLEIMSGAYDGSGSTQLTSNTVDDKDPAWSPNGSKIAFAHLNSGSGKFEIWIMNADGTGQAALVTNAAVNLTLPSWSSDGSKIAYQYEFSPTDDDIYRASTSGLNSGIAGVRTSSINERNPAYAPTSDKILYSFFNGSTYELDTVNDDGTGNATLLSTPGHALSFPSWGPRGTLIAYQYAFSGTDDDIYTAASDGSSPTAYQTTGLHERHPAFSADGTMIAFDRIGGSDTDVWLDKYEYLSGAVAPQAMETRAATIDTNPDWRPITGAQVRPVAATPMYLPLVPAFFECSGNVPFVPNTTHDPPFAYPACGAPEPLSANVTVGEPLVNGKPTKFTGFIRLKELGSDGQITVSLTDARCSRPNPGFCTGGPLSDFTGTMTLHYVFRLTDRANGTGAATVFDAQVQAPVPCTATGDTTVGSTCGTTTTLNTVVPGAVVSGKRAIWELRTMEVRDGIGCCGGAPFATVGNFYP